MEIASVMELDPAQLPSDPCPICYEELDLNKKDVVQTECNHKFHRQCLLDWLNKSPSPGTGLLFHRTCSCPMCLREISEEYILNAPGNGQPPPESPATLAYQLKSYARFLTRRLPHLIYLAMILFLLWIISFLPIVLLTWLFKGITYFTGFKANMKYWPPLEREDFDVNPDDPFSFSLSGLLNKLFSRKTKVTIYQTFGYDAFVDLVTPDNGRWLVYTYLDLGWHAVVVVALWVVCTWTMRMSVWIVDRVVALVRRIV